MKTEKITIVGFAADMCVMLTATDARMLGYKVWVPEDCTAAESGERKDNALQQLHAVFKCSARRAHRNRG
ncbi:Isochorismatase family protein [compost metagenome]